MSGEVFEPGPVADKDDFLAYGQSVGATRTLSGRAWGALTLLYDRRVNAAYHQEFEGSYYTLYKYRNNSPINFHHLPKDHPHERTGGHWRKQLNGLNVRSLLQQLDVVDTATREFGMDGLNQAFGPQTGPAIVDFLRGFAAHAMQKWEEEQADEHDQEAP